MRYLKFSASIGVALLAAVAASAQKPSIVTGGVLNAASFAKDANGHGTPVAPGSLVAIFGSNLGTTQADADTVPFSSSLGGVSVSFGGFDGKMRDVVPAAGIVNVQVPFEVQPGTTVNAIVTVNGVASDPAPVQIVAQAPGIFTIPPGAGYVIMFDLSTGLLAAPVGANLGYTSAPIPRGNTAFFYATGVGAVSPPINDGEAPNDGTARDGVHPTVTFGGVAGTVLYSGEAPTFPGVYQVNVQIPANAPTGDAVDMRITSADGTQVSPGGVVKVAIK